MIPEDEPLMQYYMAEGLGASQNLPPLTPAEFRSFNEHVRRLAGASPAPAAVFAGYSLEKAVEYCPSDQELLDETARLFLDIFLSHDFPRPIRAAILAAERAGVASTGELVEIYLRAGSGRTPSIDADTRADYLTQARDLAGQLVREDASNWALLARALRMLGDAFLEDQQWKRAAQDYRRALDLCEDHADEQLGAVAHLELACARYGLASTLLERDDPLEADRHLEAAERVLRQLDTPPAIGVLGRVLHGRAKVAAESGNHRIAETRYGEALDCLRQSGPWPETALAACYASLGEVLGQLEGPPAVLELERTAMGTDGLLAARAAGQWQGDAARVFRMERENARRIYGGWPSEDRTPKSLTEPEDIDLLTLLNLDAELIERRADYLQSQKGAAEVQSLAHPREHLVVRDAWRAVRVMQEVAVALLGRRLGDDPDWHELVEGKAASGGGIVLHLHDEATSLDRVTGYCIEVRVEPYVFEARAAVKGSSVATRLAKLHRSLSEWLGHQEPGARPFVRWSLALPCVRRQEVGLVYDVFRRGAKPVFGVGGRPYPLKTPLISLEDFEVLDVMVPEPDDDLGLGGHSFGEDGLTFIEQQGGAPSARLLPRLAAAFSRLISSVLHGDPKVAYCQAPRGTAGYLDWLLREAKRPVNYCNTFYWAPHGADTCGETRCKTYLGQLQSFDSSLWERARELALREGRARKASRAPQLWETARSACPDDPCAALAAFREQLARSAR